MSSIKNSRVILKSRPGADSEPKYDNFQHEPCEAPMEPKNGEITIQTIYLSLDPALRCRMNDDTGVDYMKAWQIGEPVLGLGGIGLVTKSDSSDFITGDLVQALINWPWVKMFNTNTDDPLFKLYKIDVALKSCPQAVLSLLGMTGLTSYLGVKERGHVTEGANQTFVVSAAAGACGNLTGQIAKLLGAKQTVGICGTDEKCDYLRNELGFDATINYKTQDVEERLRHICPDGIHGYFDNVGGNLSETIIKQMTNDSHVILCGQIAVYNKDVPYPPPISQDIQDIIKTRNITRERFLVLHYEGKFQEGLKQLQEWYHTGKLKVPEVILEGLESAGEAFVNMMTSVKQNKVGKQMVHIPI